MALFWFVLDHIICVCVRLTVGSSIEKCRLTQLWAHIATHVDGKLYAQYHISRHSFIFLSDTLHYFHLSSLSYSREYLTQFRFSFLCPLKIQKPANTKRLAYLCVQYTSHRQHRLPFMYRRNALLFICYCFGA